MIKISNATVVTAQNNVSKAAVAFVNGQPKDNSKPAVSNGPQFSIVKNPLENFASLNMVWTLSCLTPAEFNNPSLYRNSKEPTNVIFSSAGRFDESRVNTASGKPEFYINNFTMRTVIASTVKTGNSNALKFEWELFEPYSMGLLLQSLQVAAKKAGYTNYLDNAPYLLRLDFKGFDENGTIIESVKSKFFVLKITRVSFQVSESGSTYKMEGIPFNHIAFSEEIDHVYNDVKILADTASGTVEEVLRTGSKSLCSFLNGIEEQMIKENKIEKPDIYDIQFPVTSEGFVKAPPNPEVKTAKKDPNGVPPKTVSGTNIEIASGETSELGKSKFGFDQSKGGNYIFKNPNEVINDDGILVRDKMSIDVTNRAFMFAQGQSIISIINQIMLSSEYAFNAVKQPDGNGYVKWWKIDVQIEFLQFDTLVGDFAKKFTFRVVPNLVHQSIFTNPTSAVIGLNNIKQKIAKRYDYIYTGLNQNIIKFDVMINNLFYTGTNSSQELRSALVVNPNTGGPKEKNEVSKEVSKGGATDSTDASLGRRRLKRSPRSMEVIRGGSQLKTTEQLVAEDFHRALVYGHSADMIKINLEVLGDPYWMVDSGLANYFASKESETAQITDDGTMNYESGDVFIYISLRTPIDVNEVTGLYDFNNTKESSFSGIYRVVLCENQIVEGMFKQKLECVRLPGQPTDFDDPLIDAKAKNAPEQPATAMAVISGPEAKPPASPNDIGI